MKNLSEDTLFGFEFTFMDENSEKIEEQCLIPDLNVWWEKIKNRIESYFSCLDISELSDCGINIAGLNDLKFKFHNNFWFKVSVDPRVVEVQTKPITLCEIENTYSCIIQGIFDVFINTLKMEVGNGGGHVNVDYQTGFCSDFFKMKRMLVASECYYMSSIKDKSGVNEVIDVTYISHDPFISSDRIIKENPNSKPKNYYSHWRNNVLVKDEKNFKEEHIKWLLNHPTDAQDREFVLEGADDTKRNRALHYQAVNIEHIFEENPIERRLEFRFFKAQRNIDDILECINIIDHIKGISDRIKLL